MRTPLTLNRRSMLVGGGVALAIPFLPSLANAQAAQPRKYFLSWRVTNGYLGRHWYPSTVVSGGPGGLQLVEPNVREMRLSDISGPISPILDAGFDPFRSQTTVLGHIDHLSYVTDHGGMTGLTGWRDKSGSDTWSDINPGVNIADVPPSIDQLMARRIYGSVAVPPLNLSINYAASSGWSCSFKKASDGTFAGQPGLYPRTAFNLLFSSLPGGTSTAARRAAYKGAAIDLVKQHYDAVKTNPRLSTQDRLTLDRYVDELYALGQRLKMPTATGCAPPAQPADFNPESDDVDAMAAAQVDLAVAAIKCGLTRIVNLYLDPDVYMPGIGGLGYHSISHDLNATNVDLILKVHQWQAKYLKRLLTALDSEVDPSNGKSYLYNSLILWNNEIGNQSGADGMTGEDGNHICIDGQYALFGSAGGYLRPGYFVDYRTDATRSRWSRYIGTAYNRLLITCMLAMGLQPSDWEMNGQPGYGSLRGSIYGMSPPTQVVIGDLRAPLPRLKV
jgi:hypothetical protein